MARKILSAITRATSLVRTAGIAGAVEDLKSAIAYARKLPGIRSGPLLLAGQSRGGFLAMHYVGLKPSEVMGAW